MARFKATITDYGSEVLTRIVAQGRQLQITGAGAGDGIASVSPNTLTELVSPLAVDVQVGEKEFIEGTPSIMKIPVQVTNAGLDAEVWVREVAIYATDSGKEFLLCYSWLDGEDSDNVIPPPIDVEFSEADTVHIHDVAVFVTNQENSAIQVQIGSGSAVTYGQMVTYAAPIAHTQAAETIMESVGQNTEEVQRRQDYDIQAIKEQLNTGFTGTTVTHSFAPEQLNQWKGYDGTGLPEGILDTTQNRLYL